MGRRHEIAEVRRYLSSARLVTLVGVGGVGKTRLALEVASRSRAAFGGVCLVDLSPVRDAALVAQTMVEALDLPDQSSKPAEQLLVEYLADMPLLIVMDNCEHVADTCAMLVDRLLRGCPRLRILATSRQTLAIQGERVYTVAPLTAPNPECPPSVPEMDRYESVHMLVDRAVAVQPEFRLTEENRVAVARLCARLDGLPLAIELAAARLRTLSMDAVASRLQGRFDLLTSSSPAALPRQRTLRATIDWSYELCSPEERLLWDRLSVFAGGFDLEAAEEICADEDRPRHTVLDMLQGLVEQSVILVSHEGTRSRYRMLETIRQYGSQRLRASGEHTLIRRRHLDYFLGLAQRVADAWIGPGQLDGLARLRAEHDNFRVALEWAITDDPHSALALAAALRFHWTRGGYLSEGRRWLDGALAACPEGDPTRFNALWVAAWVTVLLGDHAMTEKRLDECARLADTLGDRTNRAHVSHVRGFSANFRGRAAEAIEHFERALGEFTAVGDDFGVLMVLFQLAEAWTFIGDPRRAADAARRAISLAERRSEVVCRSYALWTLGLSIWAEGNLGEAATHLREALRMQQGFRDHLGTALMIDALAAVTAEQGELPHAARLLGAAQSIWRTLGSDISAFHPYLADGRLRCEQAIASRLPAEVAQAERAEGARMNHGQAIACALGEHPDTRTATSDKAADTQRDETALTAREREIATLIAQGMSNRRIAERLVISTRTVDSHVEHILTKLDFVSRAQVAAWVASSQCPPAPPIQPVSHGRTGTDTL